MASLNLFKSANLIKSYQRTWKSDEIKYSEKLTECEREIVELDKIIKNNPEKYADLLEICSTDVTNIDETIIPPHEFKKSNNVLAFVWDSSTPFFHGGLDLMSDKFSKLKETLQISNDESFFLEENRSSKSYGGHQSHPSVNDECMYSTGQFVHLINRSKAHIGFIIDKPTQGLPITSNLLAQSRLEQHLDGTKRRQSEKKMKAIERDTMYNRICSLEIALENMITNIMAFPIEKKCQPYSNLYIILNPIMDSDTQYSEALVTFVSHFFKKIMIYVHGYDNFIMPKTKIITVGTKIGFTCKVQFAPSKSTASRLNELVIFI